MFGLLQAYVEDINNEENPVILSALENVLLSKAKNISENIMGFDVVSELKKEKDIISKKISEPPKLKNAFLKEYVETENFGRQHFVRSTPTVDKRSKEYANCEAFKKKAGPISGRSSESNSFTF